MKCPKCKRTLKKVLVHIHGAKSKAVSYQCSACDYFSFDQESSSKVLNELRSPLRLRQRVVKLSAGRLGVYFSKDLVHSIDLKQGESVYISVPDEKTIILERGQDF